MGRFAGWLGGLGVRRPATVITVVLLLVAVSAPGLSRLRVSTDLSALLPGDSEASEGLSLVLEGLADADAVYGLLEVRGAASVDVSALEEMGAALCAAFAASTWVEESSWRPAPGMPSSDPRALFGVMDDTALEAALQRLAPEAAAGRALALRQLLAGPVDAEMVSIVRSDPFGLGEVLGEHISRRFRRLGGQSDGFVSADGRALVVMITPAQDEMLSPDGESADPFYRGLNTELQAISARVMQAEDPGGAFRFGLTGAKVQSWQISEATRAEAAALSLVSLVAILLLYLLFYRSLRSLGIVLLLLPISVLLTLGWAGYFLGPLNPLAVGFVAIVFGLGIDPAIHLISTYRGLRQRLAPERAAVEAIAEVGPAVVLATTTTAAALLLLAVLDPVQGQVGLLAGVAVLVNGLVMLSVLPALWVLLGLRLSPDPGLGVAAAGRLSVWMYGNGGRVITGSVVVLLALLYLADAPRYDASLRGFQPTDLESVRVQRALEAHFGDDRGELFVLTRGGDLEDVLETNDRWAEVLAEMQAEGQIAGFDSMATLRPAAATAVRRQQRLRERVDLAAAAEAMRAALAAQGFAPSAFEQALGELAAGSASVSLDPQWLRWLEQRFLQRVHGEFRLLTRVYPAQAAEECAALLRARAPAKSEGVSTYVTGRELVEGEASALLRYRLPRLLVMLTLGLLAVLALAYRQPRLVSAAFLPLSLSGLLFVLVHCALGAPITPFTMAGLLLLIGVGIDDHLFMLARYLRGGRPGSLAEAMSGAGRAILVTTMTSLAAFGVLSFSRFEALAQFGRAAALALSLAFLASVILLPALLARWAPGEDAPGSTGT
jgi:predicted RND superfamily exporter protein